MINALASACVVFLTVGASVAGEVRARRLAPPVVEGRWLRPAAKGPAEPMWGHADGLRVGLWPLPGPRGLLRIYAPYVRLPERRVINFIAVEPIVAGRALRGFSELEWSGLDRQRGKRFWSADGPGDALPRRPDFPARGVLVCEKDVEALRVFVFVEPFASGARAVVRLTFRADRPHELGLAAFAQPGSVPMTSCVLTATMGNYARLRRLHLRDRTVLAGELWARYRGSGFATPRTFPLSQLCRTLDGGVLLAATPDETDPRAATYAAGTPEWWRYHGEVASQYWRAESPHPKLVARVNGRYTYWQTKTPIPGGIAYENIELIAPHQDGQEFLFGVTRRTPETVRDKPTSPQR